MKETKDLGFTLEVTLTLEYTHLQIRTTPLFSVLFLVFSALRGLGMEASLVFIESSQIFSNTFFKKLEFLGLVWNTEILHEFIGKEILRKKFI
jgi:hypothetical protein